MSSSSSVVAIGPSSDLGFQPILAIYTIYFTPSKNIVSAAFLWLIVVLIAKESFAWNEVTHKYFTEYAAEVSVLGAPNNNYLETLGFTGGMDEKFSWDNKRQSISLWFQDGAFFEDAGTKWDAVIGKARFNNHFHNPLKPWDSAGLSDMQTGESSLLWAQDPAKQSTSIGGDWSWKTIRSYFYNALTTLSKEEREAYLAQTFKGLGHQMHLIQDSAQPAHVRNDAHPADGAGWVEGLETGTHNNLQSVVAVKSFAPNPEFPQVSLAVSVNGLAPISQLIDTRQYIANTTPSTSLTWGLSEHTNSNFVSDDTIFTEDRDTTSKHYFPYPRHNSQCYEMFEVTAASNKKKAKRGRC